VRFLFNWVDKSFAFDDGRRKDLQRMPTFDAKVWCARADPRREN